MSFTASTKLGGKPKNYSGEAEITENQEKKIFPEGSFSKNLNELGAGWGKQKKQN